MGNGKSTVTVEGDDSQGYIQEGAGGGNFHHEQSCSSVLLFSFPQGKKTWLKGASSSVLDRFRYFSCFI